MRADPEDTGHVDACSSAPRLWAQMKLVYAKSSRAVTMTATLFIICNVQQIRFRLDNPTAGANCLPRELVA